VQGVRGQARLRPGEPVPQVPVLRLHRGHRRRPGRRRAGLQGVPPPAGPRGRAGSQGGPGRLRRLRRGRPVRRQRRHRPLPVLWQPPGEPAGDGQAADHPPVDPAVHRGRAAGGRGVQPVDRQPLVRPDRAEAVRQPRQARRRLRPVLDVRLDDLHPLHRAARRRLHRHRDLHRPRRPGQHGDQDAPGRQDALDLGCRRGAALLRRRAGVRQQEHAREPHRRAGAVAPARAGGVQAGVPQWLQDRALRRRPGRRLRPGQGDHGRRDPRAVPPRHRRRPPAARFGADPAPGRDVQAHPDAGVGGGVPLPRHALPDPGQRPHRAGGRRPAVQHPQDRPAHPGHPARHRRGPPALLRLRGRRGRRRRARRPGERPGPGTRSRP
jgi:hypothetical protein